MLDDIKKDADAAHGASASTLSRTSSRSCAPAARTPALLEHIKVDYYGTDVPLKQVANISVEDARTLVVSPWEKTMVQAHREGDHQVRPRPAPDHRRHGDPHAAAAADRGAPQAT